VSNEQVSEKLERIRVEKGMPTDWLEYTLRHAEELARKQETIDLLSRTIERQSAIVTRLCLERDAKDAQLVALVGEEATNARAELLAWINLLQTTERAVQGDLGVAIQLNAHRLFTSGVQEFLEAQERAVTAR
jgi:hypothetical protein